MDVCSVNDAFSISANQTLLAAYCAADNTFPNCFGICANADVSGVGVRIAFYSQSIMNVLLIWLSPDDAASGAWAAAVLTFALVIPAIYSKIQQNMTLHHAILVLNFATLSTVASVAAAPMVPIWRRVRHSGKSEETYDREVEERTRGRVVLSFALLSQIVMQWVWAILLFVDPFYAQSPCSANTEVFFFFGHRTAAQINAGHFGLWAFWLLLCLCSSLIFGVVMVVSCPNPVHDKQIPVRHHLHENPTRKEKAIHYVAVFRAYTWPEHDPHFVTRCWIRLSHLIAFIIGLGFVIISELQITANDILAGETNIWSFSQSAAILLALAPMWPIGIAYIKRRENRHVLKKLDGHKQPFSTSPKAISANLPDNPDTFSPTAESFSAQSPTVPEPAAKFDSELKRRHTYQSSVSSMGPSLSYFPEMPEKGTEVEEVTQTILEDPDEEQTPSMLESGMGTPSKTFPRRPVPVRKQTVRTDMSFDRSIEYPPEESSSPNATTRRSRPKGTSVSFVSES